MNDARLPPTRRAVLGSLGTLAGAALLAPRVARADAATSRVTLLHTNDTHSRLEPFEKGKLAGLGGIARRATLIRSLRARNPHTLVLDAGDTFQGTPYYNAFAGHAEFETMSAAGYDCVTLGNHDFDKGVDALVSAMTKARFAFVSANYDIDAPGLRARVVPHEVRTIGGRRIGLFGLGVSFAGLVSGSLHAGVRYQPPVATARATVDTLRQAHGVDAVVLLSHLGYFGHGAEPGDVELAEAVPGIDVIIGGHTHTFLDAPHVVRHRTGGQTAIVQVGSSGTHLGQVDLLFGPGAQVETHARWHLVDASSRPT
ncbi:metallophosphatase [Myxococcota bacterium]|nr:metallophosphatase [Myxococcota bacterium]